MSISITKLVIYLLPIVCSALFLYEATVAIEEYHYQEVATNTHFEKQEGITSKVSLYMHYKCK